MKKETILIIIVLLCITSISAKPLIVAHRGASAYEKDNTLASFDKAVALNADFIELDISYLRGEFLVSHKKEKSNLTLSQALLHLSNKTKIIIDLKEQNYEKKVGALVLNFFNPKEIIVTSINPSSLRRIKELNPNIKTGLVLNKKNFKNILLWVPFNYFPYKRIKDSKADYLFPDINFINQRFIKNAEKQNLPLFVWTINNKKLAEKLSKEKIIKGIVTNDPAIL